MISLPIHYFTQPKMLLHYITEFILHKYLPVGFWAFWTPLVYGCSRIPSVLLFILICDVTSVHYIRFAQMFWGILEATSPQLYLQV